MHIVDGALANEVVIGGTVIAVAGIGLGLKNLPAEKMPAAGVLSATFFVASLIHVPIGPSSVHLIMNGLAGLVLGWAAFPALFVGLLLQAVFFGFGGLTVLGVNTLNIAMPAVMVYYLCRHGIAARSLTVAAIWGGVGGGLAIALTTGFVAIALALSGDEFIPAAKLVFFAHIPIMIVEALVTGAAVVLARRVKPELFAAITRSASKEVTP
ncbi:cobalt transporter CbiM [Afifella pfennigii]|uniref:cobalt transporter CbiM n=1 Tax=Afifella pfennigii TaxID=209897 RepID=UPI00054CDAAA|nr:cobalt transporter CbiM [Afifella pfennigii]